METYREDVSVLKADAVFEGGGVKGIGLVGAVKAIEEAGYVFENMVGTSAGAIVGALLAVGYTAGEVKSELDRLDYRDFLDAGCLDRLGLIGKGLSIAFELGIYEGDFFESWLDNLLKAKKKTTFGQIRTEHEEEKYRYKLQVIVTDITERRLLVLPHDLTDFVADPDEFSIARAVRMSMSLPVLYEPVRMKDRKGHVRLLVDGGVLSNYPIWLLDDATSDPPWPTFGFKLIEVDTGELKPGNPVAITNPVSYLTALISTMLEAHDKHYISRLRGDFDRTIRIPTEIDLGNLKKEIKTTDFGITQEESDLLFRNGERAAVKFLEGWDFESWKEEYR